MEKIDIKAIKISQRLINKNIKVIEPVKNTKDKKLADEATERIKLRKIEDAEVIIRSKNYITTY